MLGMTELIRSIAFLRFARVPYSLLNRLTIQEAERFRAGLLCPVILLLQAAEAQAARKLHVILNIKCYTLRGVPKHRSGLEGQQAWHRHSARLD